MRTKVERYHQDQRITKDDDDASYARLFINDIATIDTDDLLLLAVLGNVVESGIDHCGAGLLRQKLAFGPITERIQANKFRNRIR